MEIAKYVRADSERFILPAEKNTSPCLPYLIASKRPSKMEADLSTSSISNIDQEELLKSAKAKMGEVKEENERLKKLLTQIAMDYKSLEKQISSIAQSKETKSMNNDNNHKDEDNQDPEMVSLTLGSWSSNNTNKKHIASHEEIAPKKRRKIDGGLELGLDCKFEQEIPDASATNSMKNSTGEDGKGETKEEENIETWSPNRDLKSKEKTTSDEDQSLPQPQVKKTRVCIRSRCDTPTMNDGCQWRKYGQKIAKGNPCPRAYYRCTVSPTCPVRKQVQRYPDDMSILITTYEGTHDHPLPLAATAMASATSAAAAMLKSGSLASQQTLMGPNHPTSTTTTSSFGLQMSSSTLMNPFNTTTNPRLSITNPSMISASSHSHPTVTLDLTTPNTSLAPFNNWLSSSSSSRKTSSSFLNFSSPPPPPPSTSLDFTTTSISALPKSTNSSSWANGYFNYGTLFPFNNNNINNNNSNINARNNVCQNPSNTQQSLNETIATMATKAIASNPNFQSFLAAAISSYVGNNNNDNINNANNDPKKSTSSPSSNSQGNSLTLFPSSKNNASVAADTRDHIS